MVGWAYAWDKVTSERLCAKNAGGLMRKGSVFAGHYGIVPFQELKDTYTYLTIIYIMHSTLMYVKNLFLKCNLDPRGNVLHTL